ncbi:hypothetical protein P691DRAFT_775901 [Macrolepiota fuliginosa MF-IS2]|uniref:Uncharacterized protein n=1 Tax=Macrolepiota fuliginosa MF-IS2 TaxID=1400762 RepID=A0A9P5XDV5_9AGAR|nr:hypothetical protein P691DRAFT_775901 [Macrolepiota fuliginosa MF-IS2]
MSTPEPTTTIGFTSDDTGGMQRGVGYFFGFLITFVVLLLIFVGCGVVSRRRFAASRQARFEWDMEPWTERMEGGDVGYVPPMLMEKDFATARDETRWKDLTPLAALVVDPQKVKQIPEISNQTQVSQPSPPLLPSFPSPTYATRDYTDPNLDIITRTLSASRIRSESLSRTGSRNTGLVRVTSPTPYYRNPNVILAQHDGISGQPSLQQEQGQRQDAESVSRRHGLLHSLNPASWFRSGRQREGGQGQDEEQGIPSVGTSAYDDEKSKEDEKVEETKDKMLQIAVLIQMPSMTSSSRSSSSSYSSGERLPGYEVGVASLPWAERRQEDDHWRYSSSSSGLSSN